MVESVARQKRQCITCYGEMVMEIETISVGFVVRSVLLNTSKTIPTRHKMCRVVPSVRASLSMAPGIRRPAHPLSITNVYKNFRPRFAGAFLSHMRCFLPEVSLKTFLVSPCKTFQICYNLINKQAINQKKQSKIAVFRHRWGKTCQRH